MRKLPLPTATMPVTRSGRHDPPWGEFSEDGIAVGFERLSAKATPNKRGGGAKPRPLLADQAQIRSAWSGRMKSTDNFRHAYWWDAERVRSYHRVVLDDGAAKLVSRTAHTPPKQMRRMTELAIPPYDSLWVEMSFPALMEPTGEDLSGREGERIAFVYRNLGEGRIQVNIIQHADGNTKKIHEWPIGYLLSNLGETVTNDEGIIVHGSFQNKKQRAAFDLEQTERIWGYDRKVTKDLKTLVNLAAPSAHPEEHPKVIDICLTELQGSLRRAVAILALMNTTIIEVGEQQRPKGQFIQGGTPKPYLSRSTAVLNIPRRVKHIQRYVEDEIRHEVNRVRKRRHHVRGHFRHLSYEPINGEGWVPCFCLGREAGQWWHKHIHEHERGDESLGRVEHDYDIAHGDIDAPRT